MAMSRKHYGEVAQALNDEAMAMENRRPSEDDAVVRALTNVACKLADMFAKDNPSFDRERFMVASGL